MAPAALADQAKFPPFARRPGSARCGSLLLQLTSIRHSNAEAPTRTNNRALPDQEWEDSMKLVARTLVGATVALGLSAGPASAQRTLTFASLPQGSILNLLSTIASKMLIDKTDIKVSVAPMRGTEAVIQAVDKGRAEFVFNDVTQLAAAINGKEYFKGRPVKHLRAIAKVVTFPVGFMVRKNSPIKTVQDLKGKRLPVGWKAFQQGLVLMQASLAAGGLTFKDIRGVPTIGLISAADDFKAGKTDATMIAPTAPKVREVDAAVGGVRFLSLGNGPKQLAAVKSIRKDFYITLVKPARFIPGVVKPTYMLAFDVALVTNDKLPDAVAYKVAKAFYENKATLVKGHPIFHGYFPKQSAKKFSVLRYHPGAIKFYKEVGIWKR
jgi:TRAP transporter TAXI family solute receptor